MVNELPALTPDVSFKIGDKFSNTTLYVVGFIMVLVVLFNTVTSDMIFLDAVNPILITPDTAAGAITF